jgi:hypothetical protein
VRTRNRRAVDAHPGQGQSAWRQHRVGARSQVALADTATELVLNQKRGRILPVDLSTEPAMRDLLSTMDTTDQATEN